MAAASLLGSNKLPLQNPAAAASMYASAMRQDPNNTKAVEGLKRVAKEAPAASAVFEKYLKDT